MIHSFYSVAEMACYWQSVSTLVMYYVHGWLQGNVNNYYDENLYFLCLKTVISLIYDDVFSPDANLPEMTTFLMKAVICCLKAGAWLSMLRGRK